jgi:hypothetical protein
MLWAMDPVEAYEYSVEIATAAVSAPGAMDVTTHFSFGDVQGSEYASQMFLDLLIQGWDIAADSGQDRTLDAELAKACYPVAEKITSVARETGVYGDDLGGIEEAASGADNANGNSAHGTDKQAARGCAGHPPMTIQASSWFRCLLMPYWERIKGTSAKVITPR